MDSGCTITARLTWDMRHAPIVGRDEDVRNIGVDAVEGALRRALQR